MYGANTREDRLIPITSIVTPATLSVESAPTIPHPYALTEVPQFDFTNLDFGTPATLAGVGDQGPFGHGNAHFSRYCYRGPSQVLQRLTSAVGASGDILPIRPPSLNSTWSTDFWAPDLRCRDASEQQRHDVWENLWYHFNASSTSCMDSFSYLSWVPPKGQFVPFANISLQDNRSSNTSTLNRRQNVTSLPSDHLEFNKSATLMVAVIPQMFLKNVDSPSYTVVGACELQSVGGDYSSYGSTVANNITQPYFEDATLLECEAFNSSFSATFTYRDGAQDIDVVRNKQVAEQPFVPIDCFFGPLSPSVGLANPDEAYAEMKNKSCSTMNLSGQQCIFDAGIIRTLAYQAVIDSFNRLVQGTVGFQHSLAGGLPAVVAKTGLFDTLLLNTKELAFLKVSHSSASFPSLPALYQESAGEEYSGLYKTPKLSYNNSLAEALEELFQNITISLLSETLLLYVKFSVANVDLRLTTTTSRPNSSSRFAPSTKANVTSLAYHNIYVYAQSTLWISYGLAIAFTILAVGVGFVAIVLNGASYKNNFSTILRVSRTAVLSKEVKESDGDGTEPLPRHLANSRVVIGAAASKQDSVSSSEQQEARREDDQAVSQESNLLPKARTVRTETT